MKSGFWRDALGIVLILSFGIAAAFAVAAVTPEPEPQPQRGGTLNIAAPTHPATLDSHLTTN